MNYEKDSLFQSQGALKAKFKTNLIRMVKQVKPWANHWRVNAAHFAAGIQSTTRAGGMVL